MKQRLITLLVATVGLAIVGCTTAPRPASVVVPPPPPVEQHPLALSDIKAMAKAGIAEEVILSQIRNSHSSYHLSTAEIVDLKEAGVSNKIIDFLINTPPPAPVAAVTAPPPPTTVVVDPVVAAPGPDYLWVAGYWSWNGSGWIWIPGSWILPPAPGAVWIGGYWRGGIWYGGYWGGHGWGGREWRHRSERERERDHRW